MSGVLMARVKNWGGRILLYAWGVTLSFTHPFFGEHYLTDILAGSILGLTCSLVFWGLFEHLYVKGKLSEHAQKVLLIVGIVVVLITAVLDLLDIE